MKEAQEALSRVMKLETFLVDFNLPENLCFHGTIPFDLEIVGNQALAYVVALNQEEADAQVQEYFEKAVTYWEDDGFVPDDEQEDEDDDNLDDYE